MRLSCGVHAAATNSPPFVVRTLTTRLQGKVLLVLYDVGALNWLPLSQTGLN